MRAIGRVLQPVMGGTSWALTPLKPAVQPPTLPVKGGHLYLTNTISPSCLKPSSGFYKGCTLHSRGAIGGVLKPVVVTRLAYDTQRTG